MRRHYPQRPMLRACPDAHLTCRKGRRRRRRRLCFGCPRAATAASGTKERMVAAAPVSSDLAASRAGNYLLDSSSAAAPACDEDPVARVIPALSYVGGAAASVVVAAGVRGPTVSATVETARRDVTFAADKDVDYLTRTNREGCVDTTATAKIWWTVATVR